MYKNELCGECGGKCEMNVSFKDDNGSVEWICDACDAKLAADETRKSKMYAVQVRVGGEFTMHSTHDSYRDAVDQSDMVHGRVVVAGTGLSDKDAWKYASSEQGFDGDFAKWQSMDDEERKEYENGAGA